MLLCKLTFLLMLSQFFRPVLPINRGKYADRAPLPDNMLYTVAFFDYEDWLSKAYLTVVDVTCTGALISSKWVLSSLSCKIQRSWLIIFGVSSDLNIYFIRLCGLVQLN